MSLRWFAIMGVLAIFTASSFAQMGPGRRMPERRMEGRHGSMMKELNLTPDQQKKMQQMRLDLEKKQTVLDSKIKLARIAMKEATLADKLDKAAIEKQVKEVSGLQLDKKLNVVDHLFAVYNLLTPEQQKTWKEHVGKGGMGMLGDGGGMGMMRHHQGMMGGGDDHDGPQRWDNGPGGAPDRGK